MTAITACRSCGSAELEAVLSLGDMPLANAFPIAASLGKPEPRYPLEVVVCRACTLAQITETVSPAELFGEYLYLSSSSDTMIAHAARLAERLCKDHGLRSSSLVLEAASNDGYLLQHYRRAGVRVVGIEPAVNVARIAEAERGIPTLTEFWSAALAERLRSEGNRADLFHAHNVLAHVPDVNGFVRGIARILADRGTAVIEVPYLKDMLAGAAFDLIYHEHLCYFSLTSLEPLFRRHGLGIHAVEHTSLQGGSLLLFVRHAAALDEPVAAVRDQIAEEQNWCSAGSAAYRDFVARIETLKRDLSRLLRDLERSGKRIAGYGAAAKATMLLNYVGIGKDLLEFIADRNPLKQGRFVPGVQIPIVAPDQLLRERPDYVLLLAWNFTDEILRQQAEYVAGGGRFILPFPLLSIASPERSGLPGSER